ncbi:hypothetical protein [Zongyangia hominis]|uniref:Uncharacterized protein n=1 Tax=Zongyangia hominis TaxID=2763677 RepID=A0A926IAW6_9FIRM|nr:hypothetical protein [Zongyangia hominis]MBC8570631.1 hypothetical protein [Zongyangia hominis]
MEEKMIGCGCRMERAGFFARFFVSPTLDTIAHKQRGAAHAPLKSCKHKAKGHSAAAGFLAEEEAQGSYFHRTGAAYAPAGG